MDVQATRNDISPESYRAAGLGAAAGGVGVHLAQNASLNSLAKKAVKALNSPKSADGDAFIKKHGRIISGARESSKGFFGKVNRTLGGLGAKSSDEALRNSINSTLGGYWKKAGENLSGFFEGDKLTEEISKLRDKMFADDIKKSFKNVTKGSRALKVGVATIAGVIGGSIALEIASKNKAKSKAPDEKKAQ